MVVRGRPFDFLGVYGQFQKNIRCRLILTEKNSCNEIPRRYQPYHFCWNFLFSANISGLSSSLNILPDFETLPSQRKIMFSLFNQSFLTQFFAIFLWFLAIFTLLVSEHEPAIISGAVMHSRDWSTCMQSHEHENRHENGTF